MFEHKKNNADNLFNMSEEEYGLNYKDHLLNQYKIYVEATERISDRRQKANSFFLTINTILVGFTSYIHIGRKDVIEFYYLIGIAGMVLCYTWYRLILSYKGLNSGKFKVIQEIEKQLPLSIFYAEWERLGKGKDPKHYRTFTSIEARIPFVFFLLHLLVFIQNLPWAFVFRFLQIK